MSVATPDGEFRVPEDVEAEHAERTAVLTDPAATAPGSDADVSRRRWWALGRPAVNAAPDGATAPVPAPVRDLSDVDLAQTPGTVVGAVAFGVVAAPLLGVYAVLFLTRYFLEPGVSPDITSSWTGEGICGVVAAVLALAMLVVVARAAGGRSLPVFVGAQLVVVAGCGYLLSDDASGGRSVTVAVLVLALAAVGLVLAPVSRRWFAAHEADRVAHG